MNPFEAKLVHIEIGANGPVGIISVHGARFRISLDLVPDARPGDMLLCDAGVAIALLSDHSHPEEKHDVSRNTR